MFACNAICYALNYITAKVKFKVFFAKKFKFGIITKSISPKKPLFVPFAEDIAAITEVFGIIRELF